jgi:hypothetical protein
MAQNAAITGAQVSGIFKQVYAKSVESAIPEFAILQKLVQFSPSAKNGLGAAYNIPLILSDEHGFTFGGSTASAYTLNSAIAMQIQNASITGTEVSLQSKVAAGVITRSDQNAVESIISLFVERMKGSFARRLEMMLLYGKSGLATVASGTGSSTTRVYTMSAATWAPGIWAGMENSNIDFYNGATQLNTLAPVVITNVDVINLKLTVSGNATDLTAIDTAGVNAVVYQYGSGGGAQEPAGLQTILANTGVLFGIDASAYNLWRASTYDCLSGPLTIAKVLSAANIAVGRGLIGEDVKVFVNPAAYSNLNATQAGQRMYDDSYKSSKGENGFEELDFHGPSGKMSIIPHPMVKGGDAFLVPVDGLMRVGSTDAAFLQQGTDSVTGDQEYLILDTTTNAYRAVMYSDQALIHTYPAKCVYLKNIVST